MTILAFPAVCNRCWKAAKCGSCWATMRATMKRMLRAGTAAADRAVAGALAAVVGEGGEADELADGAVGEAADLGHFGEQAGDGALGDALDLAEGPIEAGPEGIVVDERGDLAFEVAALGQEQGDDLLEAFDRLGVRRRRLALAIGDEVVRHLGEAGDEGPQVLLGRARRRRRGGPPGLPKRAIMAASMRSVFSRAPIASAKRRTLRALTRPQGWPACQSRRKASRS